MKRLRDLKLGQKMALGFLIVIFLAGVVGVLALTQIQRVRREAGLMAEAYLPEAKLSSQMSGAMQEAMYAMRGFSFSENTTHYLEGQQALSNCLALLRQARGLASTQTNLVVLRENITALSKQLETYQGLVQDTRSCVQQMGLSRQQQAAAADRFVSAVEAFTAGQAAAFRAELQTNTPAARLTQRLEHLLLVQAIATAGYQLRVANFRFQARDDPAFVETNLCVFENIADDAARFDMAILAPGDQRLLREIGQQSAAYRLATERLLTNWTRLSHFNEQRNQTGQQVKAKLEELRQAAATQAQDYAGSATASLSQAVWVTLAGLLAMIAASLYISFRLTRSVTAPIIAGVRFAQEIARGNLTETLSVDQADEVGALAQALNQMCRDLRAQFEEIHKAVKALSEVTASMFEAVTVLSSSSAQISTTTAQVSASAAETASAVSETTTTIAEVNHTTRTCSEKAKIVAEDAKTAEQIAQGGRTAVDDALEGMTGIQNQMTSIGGTIIKLSEQSQAIGEIIASVSDLAEQSNLLAVNAAIEAAKAGEQGKGFTVVAQEVKSLADQSKQATAQVRAILNDIQKAISAAVMATEQGAKIVAQGVDQTKEVNRSIGQLAEHINNSAQSATQISLALQQLLLGMGTVSTAMENIKQASQQNVTGVKHTEASARNLKEMGVKLSQLAHQNKELGAQLARLMDRYSV